MSERPARGLLDTSVLIAAESGRQLKTSLLPQASAISAVTLGELHVGVLAARDTATRARRLATLEGVADLEALPVDAAVAAHWGRLRVLLADHGRRLNVNDLWIAATAVAHDVPVITQDDGFGPIEDLAALTVVRV